MKPASTPLPTAGKDLDSYCPCSTKDQILSNSLAGVYAFIIVCAVFALMLFPGKASAQTELLVNGSFESGDLTGWTVAENAGSAYSAPPQATNGYFDPICGNSIILPQDGTFFGLVDFSGFAVPGEFTVYRDVAIPAGATNVIVSWYAYLTILNNFGMTKPLTVEIRDMSNTTLQTLANTPIPPGTFGTGPCITATSGWIPTLVDITSFGFQGQTVRLAFVVTVPDPPGFIGFFGAIMLDDISLTYDPPVASTPDLVINEVDYDNVGTDASEFIELKNTGTTPIDLSDVQLELINGSTGSGYNSSPHALPSAMLAPDAYFVICGNATNVPNCDHVISPVSNLLQNDTEAIGIREISSGNLIDALSYEGTVAGYTETASAPSDNNTTAFRGLSRFPDGIDTDDNSSDFSLKCITPGTANIADATACAAPTPTVVPTMSEWGLIVLALILLNMGTVAVIRRKESWEA